VASSEPFDDRAAENAAGCLRALPDLEGPADGARDVARRAIDDAIRSWEESDRAAHDRARDALGRAFLDYHAWETEAFPRYGVARGPAPPAEAD
jgi:hypothetical protein